MEKIIIDPFNIQVLPTRRSSLKEWKLRSIESVFREKRENELPEVIIFENNGELITADGNHRILCSMKYKVSIRGIQLAEGESFTLNGNPLLNYGKHEDYLYENFGIYSAYIKWCRFVAKSIGYLTFPDLYNMSKELLS